MMVERFVRGWDVVGRTGATLGVLSSIRLCDQVLLYTIYIWGIRSREQWEGKHESIELYVNVHGNDVWLAPLTMRRTFVTKGLLPFHEL